MNFFHPWLWLGLFAAGAPLWLHLQRRADRDARVFPAMRFLDDSPVARKAPLSLRDLLLFLARVCAVVFLTAAFTWPYIRHDDARLVSRSRVYILDNTLSQQADDGFERDRKTLVVELEKLDDSTQAAVIELRGNAETIVSFGDSRDDAIAKVKALQPSSERGTYLTAFRLANTLLERGLGSERQIIFYGDGQTNQWTENANAPPFLRGIDVHLPHTSQPFRDNAAVSAPDLARLFLGTRSQVRCKWLMQHTGKPGNATLILEANHKEILRRSMNLDTEPATGALAAEWESHPTDWIEGSIRLEHAGDGLKLDDVAWFAAPPVVEGRVAVLSRSTYIKTALSPEVAHGHWKAIEINPAHLDVLAKTPADQDADVLILEATFLQSAEVRAAVERYLSTGRGIFLCVDRVTPIITEALRKLGFSASEAREEAPSESYIGKFLLTHPVLAPFASPDLGNIFAVELKRHPSVEAFHGTPLFYSDRGEPLLFEGTEGAGHLLVASFSFDREMTNWVIEPTFVPFLDLALQHLRRQSPRVSWLEPGEAWPVQLLPSESAARLVLNGETGVVGQSPVGPDRIAHLRAPAEPGIYRISFDAHSETERIGVVNPRPEESELTYLTSEPPALAAWKFPEQEIRPWSPAAVSPPQDAERRSEYQQRIWWWLMIGAIGFLAMESAFLLARKRPDETAEQF